MVLVGVRSSDFKELEIVVLRHELEILPARAVGRDSERLTASFSPRPARSFPDRDGARSLSRLTRCCAGTAGSCQTLDLRQSGAGVFCERW
jgi:hypothetical protein